MGLIVYWTQIAEDKLDDIFYYYKLKASIKVAQNLVNGIVDTTIDLNKNPQIGQREILLKDIEELLKSIKKQAVKHKFTLCIGRSHGIHAEPITFGLKMLTFYQEFLRIRKSLN